MAFRLIKEQKRLKPCRQESTTPGNEAMKALNEIMRASIQVFVKLEPGPI
jgi:hypothetical protein